MALGEVVTEEKNDSTSVATKDIELFDIILLSAILLLIIGFGFQPALILKGGA